MDHQFIRNHGCQAGTHSNESQLRLVEFYKYSKIFKYVIRPSSIWHIYCVLALEHRVLNLALGWFRHSKLTQKRLVLNSAPAEVRMCLSSTSFQGLVGVSLPAK